MRPEQYPPQEPFTTIGAAYHARIALVCSHTARSQNQVTLYITE